jgi:hypothetical protein
MSVDVAAVRFRMASTVAKWFKSADFESAPGMGVCFDYALTTHGWRIGVDPVAVTQRCEVGTQVVGFEVLPNVASVEALSAT